MKRDYKKFVAILIIVIIILTLVLIPWSKAFLHEVKSISFASKKLSYENGEGGSFKIDKSATWVGYKNASISIDIDTISMLPDKYIDIVLVLDVSGSMSGNKLAKVKSDASELVESLLSNSGNRAALITFETNSSIVVGDLTNVEEVLLSEINNLEAQGMTNYYQALKNVGEVLTDYVKYDNRELIVLFLTDGYPNEDIPNQIGEYDYLKSKHPYMTINGIQYEMGSSILDPIVKISDNQFIADMENLNNVLFEASVVPKTYDEFTVVDYIDDEYFDINSVIIKTSIGEAILEGNKITWKLGDIKSGFKAKMDIDLALKEKYVDEVNYYPTNKKTEVKSRIDNIDENIYTENKPILKRGYKVEYEANAPDGCRIDKVPITKSYVQYNNIELSDEALSCDGYQFKGWEIVTDGVEKVNDDYFIMPSMDVTIRGIWSKLSVIKSSSGDVYTIPYLYRVIAKKGISDNIKSSFVSGEHGIDFSLNSSDSNGRGLYRYSDSEFDNYPIYYYRGAVQDNNLIYAGYCWKIVRTTEFGGVKIIYNGLPTDDGKCLNTTGNSTIIGDSAFNSNYNSPAYSGYMYGDVYTTVFKNMKASSENWVYGNRVVYENGQYRLQDTISFSGDLWSTKYNSLSQYHYTCFNDTGICSSVNYIYGTISDTTNSIRYVVLNGGKTIEEALEDMLDTNIISSRVKQNLDNWYKNNLLSYDNFLEDTIWCINRDIYDYGGWFANGGNNVTSNLYYSSYDRVLNTKKPLLDCQNVNDRFTTEVNYDNIGNKLTNGQAKYKIGLLTSDEVMLAGGTTNSNSSYYLYTGASYWLLNPSIYLGVSSYSSYGAGIWQVYSSGRLEPTLGSISTSSLGVRPVVVLSKDVYVIRGNGNSDSPYEVALANDAS